MEIKEGGGGEKRRRGGGGTYKQKMEYVEKLYS